MSHDTWIHRAVGYGVEPFARTALRPNHVTMARLTAGIAAAILFAWGTRDVQIWACALFVASFLLDRADGILARLQGTATETGHVLDLVADLLSNSLIFIGIGIGLRFSWLGAWGALLGLAAGLGVGAYFWMTARLEKRTGEGARSFGGFDDDDAMLLVPIATLLDYSVELLALAAVVAPLAALCLLAFKWKALWGPMPRRNAMPAQESINSRPRRQVRR